MDKGAGGFDALLVDCIKIVIEEDALAVVCTETLCDA